MSAFHPAPKPRIGPCAAREARAQRNVDKLRAVDKIAIVALSLSLLLGGCTSGDGGKPPMTMPATMASSSAGMVTSAPLETATASETLPVYWLGRSNDDVFLYREFRSSNSADEPIVSALRTMMSGKPLDPDYFSLWNEPSRLGASISAKNVITIDVSSDAFGAKVDAGLAERSISQLIYTATAAAAMSGLVDTSTPIQVSVLVDGHTGYKAFGHVPLDKPMTRNPTFVAPVWIIDPSHGTTYKGLPLKVTGQGVSPTGTLAWSLSLMKDGSVSGEYLSGTVNIPQGPNELGEFTFNLVPPPGTYQLSIFIDDPLQPGRKIGLDTKLVTIANL